MCETHLAPLTPQSLRLRGLVVWYGRRVSEQAEGETETATHLNYLKANMILPEGKHDPGQFPRCNGFSLYLDTVPRTTVR